MWFESNQTLTIPPWNRRRLLDGILLSQWDKRNGYGWEYVREQVHIRINVSCCGKRSFMRNIFTAQGLETSASRIPSSPISMSSSILVPVLWGFSISTFVFALLLSLYCPCREPSMERYFSHKLLRLLFGKLVVDCWHGAVQAMTQLGIYHPLRNSALCLILFLPRWTIVTLASPEIRLLICAPFGPIQDDVYCTIPPKQAMLTSF